MFRPDGIAKLDRPRNFAKSSRHFMESPHRLFPLVRWLVAATGMASLAPHPHADTPPASPARELFSDQPHGLSEHIAAWKFVYTGESFGNVAGGLNPGGIYEGMAKFGLGINFEKLAGWEGATLYANTIVPHGDSLTQKYTGDLNVVSNIDTYDGFRLYKFWFQQTLDDGRWSLRIGQIAADKECFVSEGASLFFNNAFGTVPVLSANLPAPIFPLSAPGFRGRWSPDDSFSLTGMVFSGDAGTAVNNPHNTHWQFSKAGGVLGLVELAYHTHRAEGDPALPGTFKLGVFHDTKDLADYDTGRTQSGDSGAYAMADQWVYREPASDSDSTRGLAVFGRAGVAPQWNRNVTTYDVETGFNYTGLIPSRGRDLTGIALAYTRLGDAFVRSQGGGGHYELIAELTHQCVITEHIAIQPDAQYIVQPGGLGRLKNAFAIGLRITVAY